MTISIEPNELMLYIVLCLCGVLLHFMTKIQTLRSKDKKIDFWVFYKNDPYATGISIVSCISAFIIFLATGQMNLALAFTTGYMCDSIAKNIAERSATTLKDNDVK
jgi:hypothetical protein